MDHPVPTNADLMVRTLRVKRMAHYSFADTLTAHAGGGQTDALLLAAMVNRITVAATAGDSVKLPATPNDPLESIEITVINATAKAIQVFGSNSDTINSIATATGVLQPPGSTFVYRSTGTNAWAGTGVLSKQSAALATVGAGTILAATIAGGLVVRGGAQSSAAFTDTTDTAALIIAALPNPSVGASYEFTYRNETNGLATLAGGVGVTISSGIGLLAVGPGCYGRFLVTVASATTVTMAQIEGGQNDSMPPWQFTSISSGNGTATAAQMAGGKQTVLATSGATALTTPTAAAMLAVMPGATLGTEYVLEIFNTNGSTLTITGDASVTITGTATIATNISRSFLCKVLTSTTMSWQNIGTRAAT